eukprot:354266-Chlamydomonas_euryale.AAC.20
MSAQPTREWPGDAAWDCFHSGLTARGCPRCAHGYDDDAVVADARCGWAAAGRMIGETRSWQGIEPGPRDEGAAQRRAVPFSTVGDKSLSCVSLRTLSCTVRLLLQEGSGTSH